MHVNNLYMRSFVMHVSLYKHCDDGCLVYMHSKHLGMCMHVL